MTKLKTYRHVINLKSCAILYGEPFEDECTSHSIADTLRAFMDKAEKHVSFGPYVVPLSSIDYIEVQEVTP